VGGRVQEGLEGLPQTGKKQGPEKKKDPRRGSSEKNILPVGGLTNEGATVKNFEKPQTVGKRKERRRQYRKTKGHKRE